MWLKRSVGCSSSMMKRMADLRSPILKSFLPEFRARVRWAHALYQSLGRRPSIPEAGQRFKLIQVAGMFYIENNNSNLKAALFGC